MIFVLSLLIGIAPCDDFLEKIPLNPSGRYELKPAEVFLELMHNTQTISEAKTFILSMKGLLAPEELDRGIMALLHRIHDKHLNGNRSTGVKSTPEERHEFTLFLFRIANGER